MKKNKGYTLIEMIIVIAIMAILSGVALVTLNIINEAKYNAAVNELNNQMSSLWIKTKALSQGKNQTSATGTDPQNKYPLAMLIHKNTDSSDDVRNGSYELFLGYVDDAGAFVRKNDMQGNPEEPVILTNLISIKYTGDANQSHPTLTTEKDGSAEQVLVQFNKSDGSVKYGAGTYDIMFKERTVATVYLDYITGNHYVQ